MLAGSAAAAGQPCSPPPPLPAAPLLPCLQEGWSQALCLGSGGRNAMPEHRANVGYVDVFVPSPVPLSWSLCKPQPLRADHGTTSAVARHLGAHLPLPTAPRAPSQPRSSLSPSWELLSPALAPGDSTRRSAGLLWGLETSSEWCLGRMPLLGPWLPAQSPKQVPRLPSRFGLGCRVALGKRRTALCHGKGP